MILVPSNDCQRAMDTSTMIEVTATINTSVPSNEDSTQSLSFDYKIALQASDNHINLQLLYYNVSPINLYSLLWITILNVTAITCY